MPGVEQAKGNSAEAEKLFRRCLDLKVKLLGPDHPDVAITANNLAMLLANDGRSEEAGALLRRSIDILEQTVAEGHPKVKTCRRNLGLVTSTLTGEHQNVARDQNVKKGL